MHTARVFPRGRKTTVVYRGERRQAVNDAPSSRCDARSKDALSRRESSRRCPGTTNHAAASLTFQADRYRTWFTRISLRTYHQSRSEHGEPHKVTGANSSLTYLFDL